AAAAGEEARIAAETAALRNLDSRLAPQQRRQVERLRIADVLAREDGGVRNGLADALFGARGGDDHGVVLGLSKSERAEGEQRRRAPEAKCQHRSNLTFSRRASPHAGKPSRGRAASWRG